MLKPLYRSQPVRQLSQTVSCAHHGCNVQTKIPIHIILGRRQDNILIILLNIGNPGSNILFYLVIHKNDRTCHDMVTLPFFQQSFFSTRKRIACERLAETVLAHILIQRLQQVTSNETPKRFKGISHNFLILKLLPANILLFR